MHAMRTGSETFLKAIFGKSNEQKEEPAWGWLYDADRQLDGAEAKGCLVFFLPCSKKNTSSDRSKTEHIHRANKTLKKR